jgi:hypothetical protein
LFGKTVLDEHTIDPVDLINFVLRAKSEHHAVCLKAFPIASPKLPFRGVVFID